MLKRILERGARAFGRTYDYDVSYMLDVIETSTSAGLRLTLFPKLVGYRGPKPGQGWSPVQRWHRLSTAIAGHAPNWS